MNGSHESTIISHQHSKAQRNFTICYTYFLFKLVLYMMEYSNEFKCPRSKKNTSFNKLIFHENRRNFSSYDQCLNNNTSNYMFTDCRYLCISQRRHIRAMVPHRQLDHLYKATWRKLASLHRFAHDTLWLWHSMCIKFSDIAFWKGIMAKSSVPRIRIAVEISIV